MLRGRWRTGRTDLVGAGAQGGSGEESGTYSEVVTSRSGGRLILIGKALSGRVLVAAFA